MNQVETVALWAGLIASVAGIVLSIVATVFALWVGKESAVVNQQMIKSLQKIESTVEHLSADTRELITAGWNKMLTGLGGDAVDEAQISDSPDRISEGIASEVRSELTEANREGTDLERVERLESALEDLKETVSAQLRRRSNVSFHDSVSSTTETIRELPIEAKALLSILARGRHLTRNQYLMSSKDQSLRAAIKRLRGAGLLVPLEGANLDGEPEPVYYFPPRLTKRIKVSSQLAGGIPKEIVDSVSGALKSIGYSPRNDDSYLDS